MNVGWMRISFIRSHVHTFILIAALAAIGGCRALQVERPGVVTEGDWLTEGAVPERQRAVEAEIAPPLEEAWVYDADAGFGPGSPLLLGDVVLVATRKGEVHAISLTTGKRQGSSEFGDAVEGAPAVAEGVIYVPGAWGGRALHAYSLSRSQTLWSKKGAPVEAGLLLLDGALYAADVEGVVRAYRAKDGEVLWEQPLDSTAGFHATPLQAGPGRLVVADDRGRLRAMAAETGEFLWQQELEAPTYETPASDGEAVYVPTTRGLFVALDAETGLVRWRYAIEDRTVRFTAPALASGALVFAGTDGVVRALDAATGDVRWTRQVEEAITAPPLLTPDVVYVGSMGRQLYALRRATGEVLWEEELEGRIKSGMAAREGHLVVLAEPENVYLFKPATPDYATSE